MYLSLPTKDSAIPPSSQAIDITLSKTKWQGDGKPQWNTNDEPVNPLSTSYVTHPNELDEKAGLRSHAIRKQEIMAITDPSTRRKCVMSQVCKLSRLVVTFDSFLGILL